MTEEIILIIKFINNRPCESPHCPRVLNANWMPTRWYILKSNILGGHSRSPADVCGNPQTFAGIRRHSQTFAGIRRHSRSLADVRGHPLTLAGIRGLSRASADVRGHPQMFAGIRRPSRPLADVRRYPRTFAGIRRRSRATQASTEIGGIPAHWNCKGPNFARRQIFSTWSEKRKS